MHEVYDLRTSASKYSHVVRYINGDKETLESLRVRKVAHILMLRLASIVMRSNKEFFRGNIQTSTYENNRAIQSVPFLRSEDKVSHTHKLGRITQNVEGKYRVRNYYHLETLTL